MIPLQDYVVLAAALFSIALYGALTRKNALQIMMCVELMLNAVNINLAAFSAHFSPKAAVGMNFVIFLTALAAAEIGVGLALLITIYRARQTTDIDELTSLRG